MWVHVGRNVAPPAPPMTMLCDQRGVHPMPEMIAPLHLRFSFNFNIVLGGAGGEVFVHIANVAARLLHLSPTSGGATFRASTDSMKKTRSETSPKLGGAH